MGNNRLSSFIKKLLLLIKYMMGTSMIILTLIVFLQVLLRYVFKVAIIGVEEIPVYLMIFSTWAAAVLITSEKEHIKIEILTMIIKNERINTIFKIIQNLMIAISCTVFTCLSWSYIRFAFQAGDTTASLKIPKWMLYSILLVSWTIMSLYSYLHLYQEFKGVAEWK